MHLSFNHFWLLPAPFWAPNVRLLVDSKEHLHPTSLLETFTIKTQQQISISQVKSSPLSRDMNWYAKDPCGFITKPRASNNLIYFKEKIAKRVFKLPLDQTIVKSIVITEKTNKKVLIHKKALPWGAVLSENGQSITSKQWRVKLWSHGTNKGIRKDIKGQFLKQSPKQKPFKLGNVYDQRFFTEQWIKENSKHKFSQILRTEN